MRFESDKCDSACIEENVFKFTTRISFELSNICIYSNFHTKCPLHLKPEPNILPKAIFLKVLQELKEFKFKGIIGFHNYSEPGIDPRLMSFIELTKGYLPDCHIYFSTNGFYLTQVIVDEFAEAGVDEIHISAYSDTEYRRLSKLQSKRILLKVDSIELDNRLNIYDHSPKNCTNPCYAPLNEIIINNNTDVVLCCLDWKYKYKFGNLKKMSLQQILMSGEVRKIYRDLSNGRRLLDICKRCDWTR